MAKLKGLEGHRTKWPIEGILWRLPDLRWWLPPLAMSDFASEGWSCWQSCDEMECQVGIGKKRHRGSVWDFKDQV